MTKCIKKSCTGHKYGCDFAHTPNLCAEYEHCTLLLVTRPYVLPFLSHLVLAEDRAGGDGLLQAILGSMQLDGSLQDVASILSKALFGEPMVCCSRSFKY